MRDAASQAQVDAAQPDRSTWLSANAGSGKTRVLTDRVARLLLRGENPQNILCLTYTKAAASEMQNRLFQRLGAWAMLGDETLAAELQSLGVEGETTPDDLRRARRLFAQAIETPGGLKIQTIHSFCAALLRRFPLEAGVTPQFREMDERTAALLRTEIVEEIAAGADAHFLYRVARAYSGENFEGLTGEIVRHRSNFSEPLTDATLTSIFGYPADLTFDHLAQRVFRGGEDALFKRLIPALRVSGKNDQKAADKLSALGALDAGALPVLEGVLLFSASAKAPFTAKTGTFPTKPCQKGLPDIMPQLDALMLRVEEARPARLAIQAIERTRALHDFAQIFLRSYMLVKQTRGLLDFDDLILHARDLLTDARVADWVLFRLDGGIDHILVDEAQDTSPVQWQVIERLAREFTSGDGARAEVPRTIFVVGDKKQSIYSFQGADPKEFDRMQLEFAGRLGTGNSPLNTMELAYSFRSSPAILRLVDHTFSWAEKSSFGPGLSHKAFKADMPGRVDLWPVVPKPEKEEQPSWFTPVDVKAANDPSVVLARRIAREIKHLIDTAHPMPHQPEQGGPYRFRPVEPGDFLILVQRRSDLFHEIIRECKALDLPIAGADRLKIGAELAVRDLVALLSFLATPEDDLSLAIALRSPLFGWTEDALFRLANGRGDQYLWAALRARHQAFPQTLSILYDLLSRADFLRPFELIERILTRHRGRHHLLGRLGPEAEDGIDALLAQAMAYEQSTVDSLTGFLIWIDTDDLEIKRQMDSAGNRIRVMTVHGAKGLEAPIVILPDTAKREPRIRDQIILNGKTPLWRSAKDDATTPIEAATEAVKDAQRAELDRLLYVAITRAEAWLIVASAGDLAEEESAWYNKIREGMIAAGAQTKRFTGGDGLQLIHGNGLETETSQSRTEASGPPDLPAFYHKPAPQIAGHPLTLSPSELGGAKALPGEAGLDEEAAKRRGRQIHRLMEHLGNRPEDEWPGLAWQMLGNGPDATDEKTVESLLSEAANVLQNPKLHHLFNGSLAEVAVSADLAALQGQRIHGVIDLLLVEKKRVLAVDFKTNAVVPSRVEDCPDGLLRQMGAYAHALQALYPDHEVQTALLWTKTAELMMLPHDLVTAALEASHPT